MDERHPGYFRALWRRFFVDLWAELPDIGKYILGFTITAAVGTHFVLWFKGEQELWDYILFDVVAAGVAALGYAACWSLLLFATIPRRLYYDLLAKLDSVTASAAIKRDTTATLLLAELDRLPIHSSGLHDVAFNAWVADFRRTSVTPALVYLRPASRA